MKVIKKQTNSEMCLICGINNINGLKAPFYEMEDNTVVSIFEYKEHHQSYPGRAHGGMITAMLDEIIGRAIWITEPDTWGVTMSLSIKFRKPVEYGTKLKAVGKLTKITSRTFEGTGELYDSNGNLLAEASAVYFKLSLEKIANTEQIDHQEVNIYIEDNIKEIN